jgi:putative peptide zinc metalloprotease protein
MFGWPAYRLVKNLRQRGRLPDMKMPRVVASGTVLALLLAGFLFLPLWVFGRVVQQGVLENQAVGVTRVDVPKPGGILERLYARDGELVRDHQPLASFRNPDLEMEEADWDKKVAAARVQAGELRRQLAQNGGLDARSRQELELEKDGAENEERAAAQSLQGVRDQLKALKEVTAPREGYLMSPPRPEDLGRRFDPDPRRPLCSVGDQRRMKVRVPVTPTDYRLLQEDLAVLGKLSAEVHVPGGQRTVYHGEVRELPSKADEDVPVQLTQRGGGPLPVKPATDQPDKFVPQGQFYLVDVEILDGDDTLCPGTLANARIHGRWRTAAWWTWRFLSSALDLGLI